eukprot:TRINITY_DN6538_c1_g1_i1.p1 TRINITY_DN6538_c1_g1~~TRINITY_DN6538_c1_g1_i1.p1  ORF type:complete len:722 (-),score=184.48 TRINITY_DN6538_c1_g1_i1:263-2428(-)
MMRPHIKRTICRHHARGHCAFGESCGFAHGEEELGTIRSPTAAPPPGAPMLRPRMGPPGSEKAGGKGTPKLLMLMAIEAGTKLVLKEDATIFASASSWEPIGTLATGDKAEATGVPEVVMALGKQFTMVPISPAGAIDVAAVELSNADGSVSSGSRQLSSGGICYEWTRGMCLKGAACRWPHIKLPGAGASPAALDGKGKDKGKDKGKGKMKGVPGKGEDPERPAASAPAVGISLTERSSGLAGLQGTWKCECGEVNRLARMQCGKCDARRSAEGFARQQPTEDAGSQATEAAACPPGAVGQKGRRRVVPPRSFKGPGPGEEPMVDVGFAAIPVVVAASATGASAHDDDEPSCGRGRWACPACGEVNREERAQCNSCGRGRHGAPDASSPVPAVVEAEATAAPAAAAEPLPAPSAPEAPSAAPSEVPSAGAERWTCGACGEVNRADREACNACLRPKAAAGTAAGAAAAAPSVAAPLPTPAADATAPAANASWDCDACGEVNRGSRDSCNNCGKPRDGHGAGKTPAAAAAVPAAGGAAANAPQAGPGAVSAATATDASASWECTSCGEVNRASRAQCNGCGAERAALAAAAVTRSRAEAWAATAGVLPASTAGDAGRQAADATAGEGTEEEASTTNANGKRPASTTAWAAENLSSKRICIGSMVRIRHLEKRPELNGRIVECEAYDALSGRWQVVTSDDERLRLKAMNLVLTENWQASFDL